MRRVLASILVMAGTAAALAGYAWHHDVAVVVADLSGLSAGGLVAFAMYQGS